LLGLVSGEIEPDSGRVNHGKTVEIGVLDQQFKDLARISDSRVREVLAESKTSFTIEGKDYTPAQLLERLGFAKEHLSDRKSTRLNSSHVSISYAVFCLKKKNK